VTGHWCEISNFVFFRDIANRDRSNLSVFMDENDVARFNLMRRKEGILMIDSNEMAASQTQTMARVGFNREEQR
jgi:hypothetical protein